MEWLMISGLGGCVLVLLFLSHMMGKDIDKLWEAMNATRERIDIHTKVLSQTLESIEKLESQQ